MTTNKSKKAERQFVYRQKLKEQGGLYVGIYLRGKEAAALKDAKTKDDKSYAEIISLALRHSLALNAESEIHATTKAPGEYEWEDIK